MTELVLVFLATLATLATLGLFAEFDDRWTRLLVELLAAVLWGIVGLSAYDVELPNGGSEPIMPMVVVGFGLGMLVGIYALYDLIAGVSREARETDMNLGG